MQTWRLKKAQTPIFESVILFATGVLIFIIFVSVFNIYQEFFLSVTMRDQLEEVNSFVTSNILQIALKDVDSIITIQIPKTVGTEGYIINITGDGINITTIDTQASSFSSLFNLSERFNISGDRIISKRGRIIINKQGDRIILS